MGFSIHDLNQKPKPSEPQIFPDSEQQLLMQKLQSAAARQTTIIESQANEIIRLKNELQALQSREAEARKLAAATRDQLQIEQRRADTAVMNGNKLNTQLEIAKANAARQLIAEQQAQMYAAISFVTLLYSCIATVLIAGQEPYFLQGLSDFGQSVLSAITYFWTIVSRIATSVSQISEAVENEIFRSLLYWGLYGLVIAGIAFGIWTLLRHILPRFWKWSRINLTDRVSIAVFLCAFAVIVFLAKPLAATPINLIVWMLLIDGGYLGVKAWRHR